VCRAIECVERWEAVWHTFTWDGFGYGLCCLCTFLGHVHLVHSHGATLKLYSELFEDGLHGQAVSTPRLSQEQHAQMTMLALLDGLERMLQGNLVNGHGVVGVMNTVFKVYMS